MADSTLAALYRSYSAREQSYADEATLANVKAIHVTAAAKWIALAERAEGGGNLQ